jgi:hypothetical protein
MYRCLRLLSADRTSIIMADEKDNKYSFEKLNALHPNFLEAVKEASPLAVLGSLCIAISAFTNQNFSVAQPFAITAATLFLIAFSTSLTFRILQKTSLAPLFSVATYVATGLAIAMLFAVLVVLGQSISLISKTVSTILPIITIIVSVFFSVSIWEVNKKVKSKMQYNPPAYFRVSFSLALIASVSLAGLGIYNIINAFLLIPESTFLFSLISIRNFQALLLTFFVGALFLLYYSAKQLKTSMIRKKRLLDVNEENLTGCQY